MNKEDREKIIQNLEELVENTNLGTLIPKLCERGVFTAGMIQKYEDKNIRLHERKRAMYLDLQTRGPEAFQKLIVSLMETGHLELVQRLEPQIDIRSYFTEQLVPRPRQGTQLANLAAYMLEDETELSQRFQTLAIQNVQFVEHLSREPLKVVVRKATQRMDVRALDGLEVYPMTTSPRGYFFMINIVQFVDNIKEARCGAQVDERNLTDLFEQLGYVVDKHRDLGYEDMKHKICKFAERTEHSQYDSCVVAIMSHGEAGSRKRDSTITSADGQQLPIDWVLDQFTNQKAPSLTGKPKIFFFQACRGDALNIGMNLMPCHVQTDGCGSAVRSSISDVLVGYSTLPGFVSHRDPVLGSWYIQAICEVFMEHAYNTDVEDMLKLVDQKLAALITEEHSMQTSSYENRRFHKLYFNPGL